MPTFLSFRRAVKALAESRAVCALLTGLTFASVGIGCVSHRVELASPGPTASPVRAAPTRRPEPPAILPSGNGTTETVTERARVPLPEPSPASAELTFEDPYPLDARPHSANPQQAASDDEELARWNLGGTADPGNLPSPASFHPGTRVVVDAELAHHSAKHAREPARGRDIERVQAQARSKGYWPFRNCFEAGQRDKPGLGGETRIRFTVSAHGNVSAPRVLSSELRNAESSACLLSELGKLKFSPPPARRLEVVTSIRIWPGDAELPPASAVATMPIDTSSGFEPATVRARAASKSAELRACFDDARRRDPGLWGRLALAIVLEIDGSVHRVSEVESHFPNAAAARCAAATLSTVRFPSVGGKPFSFVVALRLPPRNAPERDANTSSPAGVTPTAAERDDAGTED